MIDQEGEEKDKLDNQNFTRPDPPRFSLGYFVWKTLKEIFFEIKNKISNRVPKWWMRVFSFIGRDLRDFLHWLQMPVPRWRPAVATILLITIMGGLLIYGGQLTYAATYTFNQTDWSGGVSALTIVHPTNQTGWTKFSAQNATDTTTTPGSIKISSVVGNFTEAFSSTTYKDATATTALWDTSAQLVSNPTIISGTLYGTDETTAITTTPTIKMKNGSQTVMSTTAAANGTFSFSIPYNQLPASGDIITIWIDGATEDGTLVFRYGSSCTGSTDCTGLQIFRDQVIFSSYDGSALTHTNLSVCDNDSGTGCTDTEIGFTSNAGAVALSAGRTFRIKDASASFTQGGTITAPIFKQSAGTFTGATQAITINGIFTLTGGTFTSTSGTLRLAAVTQANGTNIFSMSTGSTFNHNNGTVHFNYSSTGQYTFETVYIDVPTTLTLNNVIVQAVDNWTFDARDITTASGDTIIAAGDFTHTDGVLGGTWEVQGNLTIGSGADGGTGTITYTGTGSKTYAYTSGGSGPGIGVNNASVSVTPAVGTTALKTGVLTLTAGSFTAPSGTLTVAPVNVANGANVFSMATGFTFDHNSGTVNFNHTNNQQYSFETVYIDVPTTLTLNNVIVQAVDGWTFDPRDISTASGDTIIAAGTFTHTDGVLGGTWQVQGNLTIGSGADGGTGTISMTGSAAQTITDSGTQPSSIVINKTNPTDTVTLASNTTLVGLTVTQGTFVQSTYTLTLATLTQSGGTFSASSSATLTIGPNAASGSTIINKSGGTFTHNSGTLSITDYNGSACTWSTATVNVDVSITFGNLSYSPCGSRTLTVTSGDTLVVTGYFSHVQGIVNTGTIEVQGNLNIGNSDLSSWGDGGSATVKMNGTGDQTYSQTADNSYTARLVIDKATGAVTPAVGTTALRAATFTLTNGSFTAPTGTFTVGLTVTNSLTIFSQTGGTFVHNGGTLYLTDWDGSICTGWTSSTIDVNVSITLGALTYSPCGNRTLTIASNDILIVSGAFTTGGSTGYTYYINGGTIEAQGNVTIGTDTNNGGTTKLTFSGSSAQTYTVNSGGIAPTGLVTINKTLGTDTVTLASNVTMSGGLTITKGTFSQGASYKLTSGAVTVAVDGTWTNTGTGDITLSGNVTNAGTVTLNSNGGTCGDVKDIVITTSSVPTTRSWGAGGTYTLWDLNVSYMTGTHTAYRTTIGTGTTWTNDDVGACTTTSMSEPNSQFADADYPIAVLTIPYNYNSQVNSGLINDLGNKVVVWVKTEAQDFYVSKTNIISENIYTQDLVIDFNLPNIRLNIKIPRIDLSRLNFAFLFKVETAYAAASVTAQSLQINSGANYVTLATLTATAVPGTGTIVYSLSNDGGSNFFAVTSATPYTFAAQGNGDLRWKAVLTGNATVSQIAISYNYFGNVTLTSSAFDSQDAANILTKVSWAASGETQSEIAKLQLRTAPTSDFTGISWCGYADTTSCDGTNYFTSANVVNGQVDIPSNNPLRNGGNDRWFQYRVTLVPAGLASAVFENINITYVVNAFPEFNPSGGLSVSQVSNSTDANYGKVKIDYSIRDPDTSTGTTTPGFVTPSFQYNIGGSWTAITTGNLSTNALANKAVAGSNYTSYTAYWSAPIDIPTNYLITAQVRVTLNDNEGANNTATSTSSNFILDTKVPVITTFKIDKTANTLNLSITDDTALQYRLSNNADLTADGVNATSGTWQLAGGTTFTNTALAWTFAATPVNPTVYLQVRDSVGNLSSQTAVAPKITAKIQIQDISNPLTLDYKEFVSWDLYVAVTGATFGSYKVYRSTDGTSFSLASTITNATSNYYIDESVVSGTRYYYKVSATDTDNDVGGYTDLVSDVADGQGGSDAIAPTITAVTVTEQQPFFATVTWTTDELSNSVVGYSISPSTSFSTEVTSAAFVTAHSVTITGLAPNTIYLFRVRSADTIGNVGTNSNSGAGFVINTVAGAIISNVSETEVRGRSATIAWNTDKNSDSYVSYSVSSSLLNPTRVGSATLVGGPPYRHIVNLPGLTAGTKYYYFVESTDATANYSKDTNSGNYYSFVTTSDAQPPVISGVSAPIVVPTSAVIVWTTDEPATTQLSYGLISGTYPTTTTLDPALTIQHVVSITGLAETKKYYYVVKSKDDAANEATSAEANFTTAEVQTIQLRDNKGPAGGVGPGNSPTISDTTAPIITNIATSDIGSFLATVSFETNEDAIGLVRYHPAKDTTKAHTAADYTYGKTHTIVLTGLILGTEYEFEVKATDKFGNLGTSDRQKFTSLFFSDSRKNITIKDAAAFQQEVDEAIQSALPSLAPPFIEQPQIVDITDSNATVTWRTNIKAYSVAAYAAEEEYDQSKEDPYTVEVSDTTNRTLDHELSFQNLKPNTRYHVQVKSFNLLEVMGKSDDLTFVTKALKVQANIASVTNSSFRAVWTTTDPTTSVVEYRNLKSGEVNQKSSDAKELNHDLLVDSLTPGTSYDVKIFGYNDKGNKIETASAVRVTTSVDTTNPQITALRIDSALIPGTTNKTQTIISWKTDEPANSTVYFKEGSSTPGEKLVNKVELTNSYVTDHAMVLSTLKSGGLYSIQVASTDQAGNQTLFPIRTIVVPRQSESIVDVIFKNFEETFKFLKR